MLTVLLSTLLASPWPAPSVDPVVTNTAVTVHSQREVTLTPGWPTSFRAEKARLERGWMVVLAVEPEVARPRQTWTPVLFADDLPAEVLARSPEATCVAVLLPSPPEQTRLYWGDTTLPERIDAARGRAQLAAAHAEGVTPGKPGQLLPALSTDPRGLRDAAREAALACE